MRDNIWLAPDGGKELVSPCGPGERKIGKARPFIISLETTYLTQQLNGFLRSKHSFLILSRSSVGENPPVIRFHYYDASAPFNQLLNEFIADSLFWSDGYEGSEKISLEIDLVEVDTDAAERTETAKASRILSSIAGAAYPLLLPYLQTPSEVRAALDKIFASLENGRMVVRFPVTFYPCADAGIPLREGRFVLFSNPVEGSQFYLDKKGQLYYKDKEPADIPGIVIQVKGVEKIPPRWIALEQGARLLTQLRKTGVNSAVNTMDYLEDMMSDGVNFRNLKRWERLLEKNREDLTEDERRLMKRFGETPQIRRFKPVIGPEKESSE